MSHLVPNCQAWKINVLYASFDLKDPVISLRLSAVIEWPRIKWYVSLSIVGLIIGIGIWICSLLKGSPEDLWSLLDIHYVMRMIYPVPLLSVMGQNPLKDKITCLLNYSILRKCILGMFVPGLLNLAMPAIIFRYMLLGALIPIIIIDAPYILLLMLPPLILDVLGLSMAAAAGEGIGRAWLLPRRTYGDVGRIEALKIGAANSLPLMLKAILIFVLSSILEALLGYVTPPFLS